MSYESDEARNQRNAQDIDFLKFMLLLAGMSLLFSDVVAFLFVQHQVHHHNRSRPGALWH